MHATKLIYFRELKSFFSSPLAYILAGAFSLIVGISFFNYVVFAANQQSTSVTMSVITPVFVNMFYMFLFFSPLITMRLFAEEKKLHTIELLFTAPISNWSIMMGKYLASLSVALFMLSLTLVFPLVLHFAGQIDWIIIGSCYLGVVLMVMLYLAVGMFASSLTDNQVVAAITSFCLLFGFVLFILSSSTTTNFIVGQIFQYLSIGFHFEGFLRGAMKSYDFVYFASFLGFIFYLTTKSLDARNW